MFFEGDKMKNSLLLVRLDIKYCDYLRKFVTEKNIVKLDLYKECLMKGI